MTLSEFNIIELSTSVATIFGAIGMLLAVTQKSRCKNLRCCFGCCVCEREIPDIENQIENENTEDEKKEEEPALSPFQPNSIK